MSYQPIQQPEAQAQSTGGTGTQASGMAAQSGTTSQGPIGQGVQGASGMGQQGAQQLANVTLEDGITDEMRVALQDFVQAANACEWCAERCIDEGPGMAECLRLCRDVADLASLNAQFIARDSVFGPELAEVFVAAADACARECAQHPHKHCQECTDVLTRAVSSTRKMLDSLGGAGGQQFTQPPQGQQFAGSQQSGIGTGQGTQYAQGAQTGVGQGMQTGVGQGVQSDTGQQPGPSQQY